MHPGPGTGADFDGDIQSDPKGPWTSYANQITSVAFVEEGGKKVNAPADCTCLFFGLREVTSIDASGLDTSLTENMAYMLHSCSALRSLDTTGWNTSSVTNMFGTFAYCLYLPSLDLSDWDTKSVTNMSGAFINCRSLKSLDLSGWDTGNVTDMAYMFQNCSALTTIYVGKSWNTDSVTNSSVMFDGCDKLVGGAGTTYDASHTDKSYAHADGGTDNPGYLMVASGTTYTNGWVDLHDGCGHSPYALLDLFDILRAAQRPATWGHAPVYQ